MRHRMWALILALLLSAGCTLAAPNEAGGNAGTADVSEQASTQATPSPIEVPSQPDRVADAALTFIQALDAEQRTAATHAFDDPVRSNWSNLPAGRLDFQRNGVRIGDLHAAQTEAMHRFLAMALSPTGYATVIGIVGAEDVLAQASQARRLQWSADNYWLAFFGEPAHSAPWAWQFGGHHLAVNVTVADGRSYMSPSFIGVEPASYESSGSVIAPLAAQFEAGRALVNALDATTRATAVVRTRSRDLVTGAGQDGVIPALEGARVGAWSADRQRQLLDVVALWTGLLPEASAQDRLAEVQTALADTYFAWYGAIDGNAEFYYRIQGPALIISPSKAIWALTAVTIIPSTETPPTNTAELLNLSEISAWMAVASVIIEQRARSRHSSRQCRERGFVLADRYPARRFAVVITPDFRTALRRPARPSPHLARKIACVGVALSDAQAKSKAVERIAAVPNRYPAALRINMSGIRGYPSPWPTRLAPARNPSLVY